MGQDYKQPRAIHRKRDIQGMEMKKLLILIFWSNVLFGQQTYTNPIIHADYSDPDVCRVGEDFYMVASSFNAVPGLPILHSRDLVHWNLIGHALPRLQPEEHFSVPRHGQGVWAPSIRFHQGEFYIYYPDPDFGIFMIKSKNILGPWSEPVCVEDGKGLIDPCPLWDDDGRVYLVHAFAGSRAGIKSILVVKPLNAEGTKVIGPGVIVYDGHEIDPTVEGPKFYKRNGYYYILAPAGGVKTGWQLALRSRSPFGPYERKVVLEQGDTPINGPHQGGWVDTPDGGNWFIHFQDKGLYGRIVHLQPVEWIEDWPMMGDIGKLQPVLKHKLPLPSHTWSSPNDALEWQWQANPQATWSMYTSEGKMRLFALPGATNNLWNLPQVLLRKFSAESFEATFRLKLALQEGEEAGIVVMGKDYASWVLKPTKEGIQWLYRTQNNAQDGLEPEDQLLGSIKFTKEVHVKLRVKSGGLTQVSYSLDGKKFERLGPGFQAKEGLWIGAKFGLFAKRKDFTNDSGYIELQNFTIHD
jgi:beta-xylosidase